MSAGLGREVHTCLERIKPLRKSATSSPEHRPSAREHYDSMRVTDLPLVHGNVIVVDDVVTRGATPLAAVSRIQELVPGARVRAFAIVRTISEPERFRGMFDPCSGRIALREDGSATRRP